MMQELYTFNIINTYDHKPLKGELKREEMESLLELIIRNEEERKKFLNNEKEKDAVKIIEEAAEKYGIIAKERYKEAFRKTVIEYFVQDETNPFLPKKELLPRWKEIHKEYKLSVKSHRDIWSRKKKEFLEIGIKTSRDYFRAIFSYEIYDTAVKALAHKLYEKEIEEFEKSIKPKIFTEKTKNLIEALIQYTIRYPQRNFMREMILKDLEYLYMREIGEYKFFNEITEEEYNEVWEKYNKLMRIIEKIKNNDLTREDLGEVEISDPHLEKLNNEVSHYFFRTGLDVAIEKVLSNGEISLQIVEDVLTKGGSKIFTLYHIKELKKGYYNKLSEKARKELDRVEGWHDNFDKFVDAFKKSEESEIYALEALSRLKKLRRINKEETEEPNNKNKIKNLKTAIMEELNKAYDYYLENSREMNTEEKKLYKQIIKEIKSTQINKEEFEKIINKTKVRISETNNSNYTSITVENKEGKILTILYKITEDSYSVFKKLASYSEISNSEPTPEPTKEEFIKAIIAHEIGHILLSKYIMPKIGNGEAFMKSFDDNKVKRELDYEILKKAGVLSYSLQEGFAYWFSDKIMGRKPHKELLKRLASTKNQRKTFEYYQTFESTFDNFPKERLFDSYFIFKMKKIINNS